MSLTPGSWLIFVGLEFFGFRMLFWDKIKSWFSVVQVSKAATTKVLDFFKKRGYSQSDVSVFLPIKFKRERKKK